jgi:GNAT superfamily N-acetyltransferase
MHHPGIVTPDASSVAADSAVGFDASALVPTPKGQGHRRARGGGNVSPGGEIESDFYRRGWQRGGEKQRAGGRMKQTHRTMKRETADQVEIVPATEEHLPALAELAGVIWRQHYPGIISSAQIEYMLAKMYSLATLREQLRSEQIRFERLLVNGRFVGFASYGPAAAPGVMKLHKCYLLPEMHGRGLGSRLLQHCERAVRQLGARRLCLAVNKHNSKALAAYQRNGFTVVESVITDFGCGFVMDDFIMAKDLVPPA